MLSIKVICIENKNNRQNKLNEGKSSWTGRTVLSSCWCWAGLRWSWSGHLCTAESSSEGPVHEAEMKHQISISHKFSPYRAHVTAAK